MTTEKVPEPAKVFRAATRLVSESLASAVVDYFEICVQNCVQNPDNDTRLLIKRTREVIEEISGTDDVGLYDCVSEVHKILRPYLQSVIARNAAARSSLCRLL